MPGTQILSRHGYIYILERGNLKVLLCVLVNLTSPEQGQSGTSLSSVPAGSVDLRLLFRLPMRDDAFFDVEGINQVFPRVEVEVEDRLVFLRACCLLVAGSALKGDYLNSFSNSQHGKW